MGSKNNPTYKILDAYRETKYDDLIRSVYVVGLVGLVIGISFDSTPVSIGGASLIGLSTVSGGIDYAKAYMEAKLDYLANNKFTKIKE